MGGGDSDGRFGKDQVGNGVIGAGISCDVRVRGKERRSQSAGCAEEACTPKDKDDDAIDAEFEVKK